MEERAKHIYEEFKHLFPNNGEAFTPTRENVTRWDWHIRQKQGQAQAQEWRYEFDPETVEEAQALARSRKPASFEEMPAHAKTAYRFIASIFPDRQVWACGSRVSGEYLGERDGGNIVRMRRILGKSDKKKVSDYDFWMAVEPGETRGDIIKLLPSWADFVPSGIPGAEKLRIPMYEWDFTKLPEHEHQRVVDAYATNQVGVLMAIHNDYRLSPEYYCCEGKAVVKWFKWALDREIIKGKTEDKK